MSKKYLLLVLVSSLTLTACGGPTVEETDATTSAVATDAASAVATPTEPVDSRPPLDPKTQATFEKELADASTIEGVRAIYNNLPDSKLKDQAAERLDDMILAALKDAKTHDDAARLYDLSLEGSTSRLMAKTKMDQFPKKEAPQPVTRASPSPSPSVRPGESEEQPASPAAAAAKQ